MSLCVCVRYCASTKALSYQRSWQSVQLSPIFPSPHGRAIREDWGRLLLVVHAVSDGCRRDCTIALSMPSLKALQQAVRDALVSQFAVELR